MRHGGGKGATRCLALGALCAGLSACAVGPDYLLPRIAVPANFLAKTAVTKSAVVFRQEESDKLTRWWGLLKDPELDRLVQRAVAENPDIEIAYTRILAARQYEVVVRGQALPEVGGAAGFARSTGTNSTRGRVPQTLTSGTNSRGLSEITFVGGFDAGWELDFFGKHYRQYEEAEDLTERAFEVRRAVLVSVVAEVARAYIDVRGSQSELAVARDNVSRAKKIFDLLQTRVKNGLTNELDVTLAARQLATLEARVNPLTAEEYAGSLRLATLLGSFSGSLQEELSHHKVLPETPRRIMTGLPADIVRRRPDVRVAERALAAATARVGVAVADLFPRVAITAGIGGQAQTFTPYPFASKSIFSIGPSLYWPLLDFGTLDALAKIQQLNADVEFVAYRAAVINAVEEVNVSLARYRSAMDTLQALEKAIAESKRAVELASERYDRGITDFLNVLDAERQEDELNVQYAVAKTSAAVGFVAVYKALGGGWEMFDEAVPEPVVRPAVFAAFDHLRHDRATWHGAGPWAAVAIPERVSR